MLSFQQVILRLQAYWDARGCAILMSATCILAVLALRLGEKAHPVKN